MTLSFFTFTVTYQNITWAYICKTDVKLCGFATENRRKRIGGVEIKAKKVSFYHIVLKSLFEHEKSFV